MALTQITEKGIKDGEILNADINASAAISKSKIENLINNNADNRVITGSGTANTLNGESNVVINAGKLGIGLTSPAAPIHTHTGNATNYRAFSNTACGGSTGSDGFLLGIDSNANVNIWNFENTFMNFATNGGERMRIDSSGRLLLGLTSGTGALLQVDEGAQVFGAANDGNSSCLTMDYSSGTGRIMSHGSSGGNLAFFTNGSGSGVTERMRIDGSGSLLVAHTSARNNFFSAVSTEHTPIIQLEGTNQNRQLSITSSGNMDGGILVLARQNGSAGANTVVADGNILGRIDFQGSGGTNMEMAASIHAEVDGTPGNDDMPGRLLFKTSADGSNNPTERMRIDSSGGLRLGTTSSNYDELFTIVESGTNNEIATWRVNDGGHTKDMLNMIHVANSGNRVMIRFRRTGSLTSVGDIVTSASSTSYVTSSDYRLKENVTSITDGITRLKTLKPYRFNFKIEPDKTVDGFLAHEASEVVPEAVVGEKDAVDAEGNIDAQAIDQSKLVPLLTAALQEEISKREALETRVATLEAA